MASLAVALVEVSMKAMHISIVDDTTVALANDYIRDGEYSDGDFNFDDSQQLVSLALWKADEELASFESAGLFGGWRLSPMRRLVLTLNNVREVRFVRQSSGTGNHPLEGAHWDHRGTVRIDTYDGITIELATNNLDGELQITDDIDRNRIQRSRSWGLERR
jgi:hypothetical protein